MALLDVRPALIQRSMCGRSAWARARASALFCFACLGLVVLPIGLPLALAAARPGADLFALVLGGCSEDVERQPVGSRHVGNCKVEALAIHQRGDKRCLMRSPVSF